MCKVALTGVVIANVDYRLILRRIARLLHVNQQKLMVQNPFSMNFTLGSLSMNLSRQLPVARQIIQKFIMKNLSVPIWRLLTLRSGDFRAGEKSGYQDNEQTE